MSHKLYVKLDKDCCTLNPDTGVWTFKLPDDFVHSRSPQKRITVLNFMYYATYVPRTGPNTIQIDFTTLHSPTLCDGNYNQDYYIGTLCYTYNSVFKTYPIKSNPQYLDFYFKNTDKEVVKTFYMPPDPNAEPGDEYYLKGYEERFTIDLELIF